MRFHGGSILLLSLMASPVMARTVIIGDSMFWSGPLFLPGQPSPLSQWLEARLDEPIENHARVGASLAEGLVISIPRQYDDIEESPTVDVLIMDGGGNDMMSHRSDCEAWNDDCRQCIHDAIAIASSLLNRIHRDGISQTVYLGFYHIRGFEEAIDYTAPRMEAVCEEFRCRFIDPRANITADMIGPDGIHPKQEGYEILAQMIWGAMQ